MPLATDLTRRLRRCRKRIGEIIVLGQAGKGTADEKRVLLRPGPGALALPEGSSKPRPATTDRLTQRLLGREEGRWRLITSS